MDWEHTVAGNNGNMYIYSGSCRNMFGSGFQTYGALELKPGFLILVLVFVVFWNIWMKQCTKLSTCFTSFYDYTCIHCLDKKFSFLINFSSEISYQCTVKHKADMLVRRFSVLFSCCSVTLVRVQCKAIQIKY